MDNIASLNCVAYTAEMNGEKRGKEIGEKIGEERGKEIGGKNAMIAAAKSLKAGGVDVSIISKSTGLSVDEIMKLEEQK